MTDAELDYVLDALAQIVANVDAWSQDYRYDKKTNEFIHGRVADSTEAMVARWFDVFGTVPHEI